MNIGIDIDDTIAKTSDIIDFYAEKYTTEILKRPFKLYDIDIIDPMWAKYLYNWSSEEDSKFFDLYYESCMSEVLPKEDASTIINKLSKNNNIFIITARWDRKNHIIYQITKNWLKENNIYYDNLFINHTDKRNIVKENNIDLFIDDNLKTCEDIASLGVKVFMMNSRLNQTLISNKCERVYSWDEIYTKIKNDIKV